MFVGIVEIRIPIRLSILQVHVITISELPRKPVCAFVHNCKTTVKDLLGAKWSPFTSISINNKMKK